MQVVEIFQSIQGEGCLIGFPMVFIRLWGCNMQCTWCDTRYSWASEFKNITKLDIMNPEELSIYIQNNYPHIEWINFTGGEPTLWAQEILETIKFLDNYKFCLQTNGKTWHNRLFTRLDKVSMDIKCPSSGEKSNLEYLANLRDIDEVKFVISTNDDFNFAFQVIENYSTKANIIFQPVLLEKEHLDEYFSRIRWLINCLRKKKLNNIRVLPQYHQLLWRDQPGT
ncbi:MAG: 7-carboxy-7-deazaguanine synthase QueE [Candidatus Hodarchaeales archaeon]